MTMKIHPAAAAFPDMADEVFADLKKSIDENGQRHPIIVTADDQILDGRHRYRACMELKIKPRTETYNGSDLIHYVIDANGVRRHLNVGERAISAAKLSNIAHGGDRRSDQAANLQLDPMTLKQSAQLLNVSSRSAHHAKKVLSKGVDELQKALLSNAIAVSTAADIAKHPPEDQRRLLADGPENAKGNLAKFHSEKASKKSKNASTNPKARKSDKGDFAVLCIDLPVHTGALGNIHKGRNGKSDHPSWTADELKALPIGRIALDTACIYVWATPKSLYISIELMRSWGFEYGNCIVWIKDPDKLDPNATPEFELLLIGARGGFPLPNPTESFTDVVNAPEEHHGEKPEEIFRFIERQHNGVATAMLGGPGDAPERWQAIQIENGNLVSRSVADDQPESAESSASQTISNPDTQAACDTKEVAEAVEAPADSDKVPMQPNSDSQPSASISDNI